jgi:methionyl aminopeptidase
MMFKEPAVARKSAEQIAKMRQAGRVVAEMHEKIRAAIAPGVTTAALDKIGREVIERQAQQPLNYHGFPGDLTSPNGLMCTQPGIVPSL